MGFKRIIALLTTIMAVGLLIVFSETMSRSGLLDLHLSWTMSYLTPIILLFVLAIGLSVTSLPLLKWMKRWKFLGVLLIFGICIGAYASVNIPYLDDWMAYGNNMPNEAEENPVEVFLNGTQPEFDGLVSMVLPGCPHCEVLISKLVLLQERNPELDQVIFVFANDSTEFDSFMKGRQETNLPFHLVPEPSRSIALCRGRFPTLFYFKNGRLAHRWTNSQFGYPALDWVEAGLK